MARGRWLAIGAALLLAASGSVWALSSAGREAVPRGHFTPLPAREMRVPSDERARVLRRARVRLPARGGPTNQEPADALNLAASSSELDGTLSQAVIPCLFIPSEPTGTTPKFDCVLDGGEVIKVKYGRNAEIHAEVAATRLMTTLGFPADRMYAVPRVRCYGCPRHPFLAMRVLHTLGLRERSSSDGSYTDFTWPAIERKFDGYAVETSNGEGWAWWELSQVEAAPRADIEALRLLAVFLAHWDNKAENQRLVCGDAECSEPLAMIQDLGATFGPKKVNLRKWASLSVWDDPRTCRLTMRHLPSEGATFPDAQISEAGRLQILEPLAKLTDEQIRGLFADARFPQFHGITDGARHLDAWIAAFKHRVREIEEAGPCPSAIS